jgi:hypothetical protein
MIRQIVSLVLLACSVLYYLAWLFASEAQLLVRNFYLLSRAATPQVLENHSLLGHLFKSEALIWLPFLGVGMLCAVLANKASRKWAETKQVGNGSVTDRFGVTMSMINAQFDHRPAFRTLAVTPTEDLPGLTPLENEHASDIEIEILGAIHASNAPADTTDAHGVTLYAHTLNTWRAAYQHDDAGLPSLDSVAAVLHDAGKVMTYSFQEQTQTWIKNRPDHESSTTEFLRRLPRYVLLEEADRACLNTLAAALAAVRTDGYPSEISEAVGRIRISDSVSTGSEKRRNLQKLKDGEVDFPDLCKGVQRAIRDAELFDKLNINRRSNASAPIKAFYEPGLQYLIIQAQSLRTLIAPHVSEHNRAALSLRQPTQGFHPSYAYIAAALEQMHTLMSVYGLSKTDSGMWALRSGNTAWPYAYIIDATVVGYAVPHWGKASSEFTVVPVAK